MFNIFKPKKKIINKAKKEPEMMIKGKMYYCDLDDDPELQNISPCFGLPIPIDEAIKNSDRSLARLEQLNRELKEHIMQTQLDVDIDNIMKGLDAKLLPN